MVLINENYLKLSENYLPNLNFAFHQILNSTNPPLVFDSDNLPDFPAELFFTDILKEVQEKRYGYDACVYAQFARLIVQLLKIICSHLMHLRMYLLQVLRKKFMQIRYSQ